MYTCIYACGKHCELVESAGHGGGGPNSAALSVKHAK